MPSADQSGPANLEELAVNTIRVLSMETVEKAKSGHPACPWVALTWPMCCSPGS